MSFPQFRPRRMRQNESFRKMIRETKVTVDDLVLPLFVIDGTDVKNSIDAIPGHYQLSIDNLIKLVGNASKMGINRVILFGIPEKKDMLGTQAYAENGIVQRAVRAIKDNVPEILVITDVCLCEYTDHGHCGLIDDFDVSNDKTLDLLAQTALSHAMAGADMVAPSDMMDGRVSKIRTILDSNGYCNIPIMSYAVKYCSNFYGPFREAAQSAPTFGDRRTYQMDPANAREALREAKMDEDEGADIIMVKPALSYLDIIRRIRVNTNLPVAAFNVSGEFSMVKAAENLGWIDGKQVMLETLTSIKRAGANMIITYFALDYAVFINS